MTPAALSIVTVVRRVTELTIGKLFSIRLRNVWEPEFTNMESFCANARALSHNQTKIDAKVEMQ